MSKNTFIRSFLLVVTVIVSVGTKAQSDSISVETQQKANDTYFNLKYEYLDILLRDETRLFKVAISPFKPSDNYDFSVFVVQLGYERKLSANWSVVAEMNQNLMITQSKTLLMNNFDLGLRRYLNKSREIRRGTSGNNCNGPYLGAKISKILQSISLYETDGQTRTVSFRPTPEMNIGIQHRISNIFYVDANTFLNYDPYFGKAGYGINVLFGIAFSADE